MGGREGATFTDITESIHIHKKSMNIFFVYLFSVWIFVCLFFTYIWAFKLFIRKEIVCVFGKIQEKVSNKQNDV